MDPVEFDTILFFGAVIAGLIGATSGLGGGIVIMPLLALFFGINALYSIGASLMGVIVTSIGASIYFLRQNMVDIKTTAWLETATVPGAIIGAILATVIHEGIIFIIFGCILIFSIAESWLEKPRNRHDKYPQHRFWGWVVMLFAGLFSGLLGIGSGAFKVIGMDRIMHIPFRTSTATSSFMIGVTAAASATAYYHMGYISPKIVVALVPGVFLGSVVGSLLVKKLNVKILRLAFSIIILALAIEMIVEGVGRLL